MSSIVQTLENLLGANAVVPWASVEQTLQAQFHQAQFHQAQFHQAQFHQAQFHQAQFHQAQFHQALFDRSIECAVYPETSEQLMAVVACAAQNHWPLLPYGQGTKLHWGGLVKGAKIAVSTAKLDRLIEHASGDLTVTAEAGLLLTSLQKTLVNTGQFLAVDPAYRDRATLGGIVATADTGALRQRYGGIRDMLIGLSFVRSDGKLTKAGGRVVKNVAGYDLMKLLTGSYGTLGIVSQVTFRIYPIPLTSATVILSGHSEEIAKVRADLLASALTPSAIELVTPALVKKLALGSSTGLIVRFESSEASVAQQVKALMHLGESVELKATQVSFADEQALWRQLSEPMAAASPQPAITCKIGVVPMQAINCLHQIGQVAPLGLGTIHANSGLGWLQLPMMTIEEILSLRQICQAQAGFLTVLAAPPEIKQAIDVWGYPGNALPVMQRLKTQFDPNYLFSPHRFVGEI